MLPIILLSTSIVFAGKRIIFKHDSNKKFDSRELNSEALKIINSNDTNISAKDKAELRESMNGFEKEKAAYDNSDLTFEEKEKLLGLLNKANLYEKKPKVHECIFSNLLELSKSYRIGKVVDKIENLCKI